jgi:hypothetical protein
MIALSGEIAEGLVFANGSRAHMTNSLGVLPAAKRSDPDFFIGNRIRTCTPMTSTRQRRFCVIQWPILASCGGLCRHHVPNARQAHGELGKRTELACDLDCAAVLLRDDVVAYR